MTGFEILCFLHLLCFCLRSLSSPFVPSSIKKNTGTNLYHLIIGIKKNNKILRYIYILLYSEVETSFTFDGILAGLWIQPVSALQPYTSFTVWWRDPPSRGQRYKYRYRAETRTHWRVKQVLRTYDVYYSPRARCWSSRCRILRAYAYEYGVLHPRILSHASDLTSKRTVVILSKKIRTVVKEKFPAVVLDLLGWSPPVGPTINWAFDSRSDWERPA